MYSLSINALPDLSVYGDLSSTFSTVNLLQEIYTPSSYCSTPTPTLTTDSTGITLNITFSQNISINTANQNIPSGTICSDLFGSQVSNQLFGVGYICSVDTNSILIQMGQSATLAPQTTMRVLDNSLFIGNCLYPTVGDIIPINQGYSYSSSQAIFTVPSMTNIVPNVNLIAASNVTACKPLTLTISVISGLANRLPTQTSFSCISGKSFDPNTQSLVDTTIPIINANLNSIMNNWTTPQLSITLPANIMKSNAQYKFVATITNYLKSSTMANATVSTSDILYPTINIQGVPKIIYPSMIFSVVIHAYLQSCDGTITSNDPNLYSYTWTQLTPTDNKLNVSIDYVFDSPNTIKFNQFRLVPNTNYSFNINVKLTSNQAISSDSSFQLIVQAQKPVAIISASDQFIGAKQSTTINASQSYESNIHLIIFFS